MCGKTLKPKQEDVYLQTKSNNWMKTPLLKNAWLNEVIYTYSLYIYEAWPLEVATKWKILKTQTGRRLLANRNTDYI